jgi:hypothetical protein
LRSTAEEFSYNANVTPEDLWKRVGEKLLLHRSDKHWNASEVERNGGPSYKTVLAIEQGRAGNVDSLAQHAQALGLSIVDVVKAVLDETEAPLSPECAQVVRKFQSTTVDGRTALLALANALPDEEPARPTPVRPRPDRADHRRRKRPSPI